MGMTGTRIWEVGPRPDGASMDWGDCDQVDWSRSSASVYSVCSVVKCRNDGITHGGVTCNASKPK